MKYASGWCFCGIYNGGLWEGDLHVSAQKFDRKALSNPANPIYRLCKDYNWLELCRTQTKKTERERETSLIIKDIGENKTMSIFVSGFIDEKRIQGFCLRYKSIYFRFCTLKQIKQCYFKHKKDEFSVIYQMKP